VEFDHQSSGRHCVRTVDLNLVVVLGAGEEGRKAYDEENCCKVQGRFQGVLRTEFGCVKDNGRPLLEKRGKWRTPLFWVQGQRPG
jgi:hypothetical protein